MNPTPMTWAVALFVGLSSGASASRLGDDEIGLMEMDLQSLMEVEITLDEVFDVFDALVREESVSIATGAQRRVSVAPAVTTVITARDIEAMGARTLEEALRGVPGLQVTMNWYNTPVYTIRGVSSAFNPEVLVLVNGIRLNNIYASSKNEFWSGFPVSTLARVEIIRGPGSALYGADAFAGVINLITKSAEDMNGTEIGARVGTFGTRDAWLLHGTQWQGFDIAFMAEVNDTDGHRRTVERDAQSVFDALYGTEASLAPGPYGSKIANQDFKLEIGKERWTLRAGWMENDHTEAGTGIAQALDPTKPRELRRQNIDLTFQDPYWSRDWSVEARLHYARYRSRLTWELFPPGAFGGAFPEGQHGYPSGSETHALGSLAAQYRGWRDHAPHLGVGYAYYDMYRVLDWRNFGTSPFTGEPISPIGVLDVSDTPAAYAREAARENRFLYVQDTWTLNPRWELTYGLRHDRYSDFGSTTNPRLGLVWTPHRKLVAKLLFGKAFRGPSFQEQYNQNNPVAIGNPQLKPEKIATWELAFGYHANDALHLALNLFRYKIRDKITLIPLSSVEQGFANASTWQGQGGEFEARWKTSPRSSVLFNYSLQDSEDGSGETLGNGPRHAVYLRGDWLVVKNWYLDGQLHWHDGWNRAQDDPRSALEGYTTVDLTLRRKTLDGKGFNFALGVRNLFDHDVRDPSPGPDTNGLVYVPSDIPGPGRQWFTELRYTFD